MAFPELRHRSGSPGRPPRKDLKFDLSKLLAIGLKKHAGHRDELASARFRTKEVTKPSELRSVVTIVTIRADRRTVYGRSQVELTAEISIKRSPTTGKVRVKVSKVSSTTEAPAVIKALAEWIADSLTKLPFEKIKAALPPGEDASHIDATADFIERLKESAHGLVGDATTFISGDVSGMPPELAAATGGIAEHRTLPLDDPLEKVVESLHATSITIDILSGGLPISSLVDLFLDAVKKDIADGICDALTSEHSHSTTSGELSSSLGQGKAPGLDVTVMYTQHEFGARPKPFEDFLKQHPTGEVRSLEWLCQTKKGSAEVPIARDKSAPFGVPGDVDYTESKGFASLIRHKPGPSQNDSSRKIDDRPSIQVGQHLNHPCLEYSEKPSITAGKQSLTDIYAPLWSDETYDKKRGHSK